MSSKTVDATKGGFRVKFRKFMRNPLLSRRQFVIEVSHPELPSVPKKTLRASLAKSFKVTDLNTIVLFGFKCKFGGGASTGFALIYDNIEAVKRYEPTHRLRRAGLAAKTSGSRKQRKERRNRANNARGAAKSKILRGVGEKK